MNARERKEGLKNEWEKCFEKKIEDALTDEGIKHFWDERTSVDEAADLLTAVAVGDLVESLLNNHSGIVVKVSSKKAEKKNCKAKNFRPFMVIGKPDRYCYDERFETPEAAYEFIKNEAMHSILSVDDFMVVKEVKHG